MSNFKLWPKDAKSNFEKGFYAFVSIGIVGLYLVVGEFSVWGVWNNTLSKNAAAAQPFWNIVGFLIFLFSVVWGYGVATDRNFVSKNDLSNVLILIAAMALSLASSAGFVFNG
jgi:hypothetical protein